MVTCACGCGTETPIVVRTRRGAIAGQHRRFAQGHGSRRPFVERFWSKVEQGDEDECWLWTAAIRSDGYGVISRGGTGGGIISAHRASWEIAHGRIPDDLFVLHRCDVKRCVNPAHLFLGTPADNTHDALAKGRLALGERVGGAKLDVAAVAEIRRRSARGETSTEIALAFGVSRRNIGMIVTGRTWRHVPAPT